MRSLDIPEGDESAGGAPGAGFKKIDNFLTDQLDRCYCFSESDGKRRSRLSCARTDQGFGFKGGEPTRKWRQPLKSLKTDSTMGRLIGLAVGAQRGERLARPRGKPKAGSEIALLALRVC
jgi:hypothetical protein